MTENSGAASGGSYKFTRFLRDAAVMVVLLAGFMLLQTEVRKQLNPLYQTGSYSPEHKSDIAAFYKKSGRGNIINDPGALYATMPLFQSVGELDKIEPAAGDE